MKDLSLKVREIDHIEIDQPDRTNACGCEVECHGRAQSARTNQQHPRLLERALTVLSHLWQEDVAAITQQLFARQLGRLAAPFNIHVGGILRSQSSSSSVGR
jgi:hypothetical protein